MPTGLLRVSNDQVMLHPDEEVQARIRLVFEKFDQLGTARAVQRYLRQEQLLLPSRPLRGPAPHEIHWAPARMSLVLSILNNPAYAGTYVYGRSTTDPSRHRPSHPSSGIIRRTIDDYEGGFSSTLLPGFSGPESSVLLVNLPPSVPSPLWCSLFGFRFSNAF